MDRPSSSEGGAACGQNQGDGDFAGASVRFDGQQAQQSSKSSSPQSVTQLQNRVAHPLTLEVVTTSQRARKSLGGSSVRTVLADSDTRLRETEPFLKGPQGLRKTRRRYSVSRCERRSQDGGQSRQRRDVFFACRVFRILMFTIRSEVVVPAINW